jgi:hypothetical protein
VNLRPLVVSRGPRGLRRRPPTGWARLAVLATILMFTPGCDKAIARRGARSPAPASLLSVSEMLRAGQRPDFLFQVFGTREAPRMLPVAALAGGRVLPIDLDAAGWRRFDAAYLRHGATYALYQDGSARGSARVTRGMWEDPDHPLYELAGCRTPTPLAAVALRPRPVGSFAVEMLAATKALGWQRLDDVALEPAAASAAPAPTTAAAPGAAMRRRLVDSLELQAFAVSTGATRAPTLITARLDSTASRGDAPSLTTHHLFVIADRDERGQYHATYTHRAEGPLRSAEFRRYLDHLDLTGDGVDELILEGWRFGGETWLSILSYRAGKWEEIFRSRSKWCADR